MTYKNTKKTENKSVKIRFQFFILCFSTLILCGKFYAFKLTNSVAILTDAYESIVNVLAAVVSLAGLIIAAMPKDKNHPFGHGKFEFLSASFEGLLIFLAGGLMIFEGIHRFFVPEEVGHLDVGIIIITLAGILNFAVGALSVYVGKKQNSIALISGGRHLQSDAYSTVGMILGLGLLYFTKIAWLDCLAAVIFGFVILFTGLGILRKTIANLTDEADEESLLKLLEIISKNRKPDWIDIHNLKVTRYGGNFYLDCDLTLPMFYSIHEGHISYRLLKQMLKEKFNDNTEFSIHFDSCEKKYCHYCMMQKCAVRKEEFVSLKDYTLNHLTSDIEHP